ncbi:MAG: thioester reductase domain-containing protein [Patescibacteria group bacterium]
MDYMTEQDPFLLNYDFSKEVNFRDDIHLKGKIILPNIENPKKILLTAATGFIGSYLLKTLLLETNATIFCLTRSGNINEAFQRIKEKLVTHFDTTINLPDRIMPVIGDLSKPLLGLPPKQFDYLAKEVDAIYHNGAISNSIASYQELKPVNVDGTHEVLLFASQHKIKPIYYISSFSVFLSVTSFVKPKHPSKLFDEDSSIDPGKGLIGGYTQSKWVAEKLVMSARKKGIPAVIFRLGRITGDSVTGVSRTDDFFSKYLLGCIKLKHAPITKEVIGLTPVDFVSQAISYLSRKVQFINQNFHITNPNTITWEQMIEIINQIGYPVKLVPFDDWIETLRKSKQNVLKQFLPAFSTTFLNNQSLTEVLINGKRGDMFSCDKTKRALIDSNIFKFPENKTLIRKYIKHYLRDIRN